MVGVGLGLVGYFVLRYGLGGFYSVQPNERAVKTVWGRAERIGDMTPDERLSPEEKERYLYPRVAVIPPGGPYYCWPWEKVYKVSVATETVSLALDPEDPEVNRGGVLLEAVTKDQLNTGLTGQLRFSISESNLYAYLFGIKNPRAHIIGYFHSVLRAKIANFEAPKVPGEELDEQSTMAGISINDLRKHLRDLGDHMDEECRVSEARYGIKFEAALITSIDPPDEVEAALAAINTAHNQVSSQISLAQAAADQKVAQSKRAVEIETNRAQAEVEPLRALASQLATLKARDPNILKTYMRNVRLALYQKANRVFMEARNDG